MASINCIRELLMAELPNVEFDEETLQCLASFLENSSVDEVVEAWTPHLVSYTGSPDKSSTRELCSRVIQKLEIAREKSDEPVIVEGLCEMLSELKLKKYEELALQWCQKNNVFQVQALLERSVEFGESIGLKPLEKTRLGKEAQAARENIQYFGRPLYTIREKVGKGGTASVHRCIRMEHGVMKTYAVKVIKPSNFQMCQDIENTLSTLKREIPLSFSLRHPNVVRLYDVVDESAVAHCSGTRERQLYLVLEFVNGGDLFDYITKHGCLEDDAARMFVQLVKALKYVHRKGIVHRDLKPENILVDVSSKDGPHVKITDFGCAKLAFDGYSEPKTTVGTDQYWAPEIHHKKAYTEKVDLWSLGVVLYVMLNGSYPFEGSSKSIITEKMQKGEFSFKKERMLSPEAKDLITKLILPRPDARMPLDQCLCHPWVSRFCESSPTPLLTEDSHEDQESVILPSDPTDLKRFRDDLTDFTTKFKFAAILHKRRRVVIFWRSGEDDGGSSIGALQSRIDEARRGLEIILRRHFQNFRMPPPGGATGMLCNATTGGYADLTEGRMLTHGVLQHGNVSDETLAQQIPQAEELQFQLNVHPSKGAGLETLEETGGLKVIGVLQKPGQEGLLVGDMIIEIDACPLVQSGKRPKEIFHQHFKNGAQIKVIRDPKR